jgi:hypothetical protein
MDINRKGSLISLVVQKDGVTRQIYKENQQESPIAYSEEKLIYNSTAITRQIIVFYVSLCCTL